MNKLLETINTDIEKLFSFGDENNEEKIYVCTRCINRCLNILDNILAKKDLKVLITKKILVIYSYLISNPDINIYDVLLEDIYKNIKNINQSFVIKSHQKCIDQKNNIEYHLNMINYYKNSVENSNNLYNYYFDIENYYNCLKLLNYDSTDYFYKKMGLLNNVCDFNSLHANISKIIEYSKNNPSTPYLLICMGLGNTIMNNCMKRFVKHIYSNPSSRLLENNNMNGNGIEDTNKYSKLANKICIFVDNPKYHLTNFIFNNFEYMIVNFGVMKSFENMENLPINNIHIEITSNNIDSIYSFLIKEKFGLLINFCGLNNTNVFKLLSRRIAHIQINLNDYLGTYYSNMFDYVLLGEQYNKINSNYIFNEKKIIIECAFLLNIDYNKNFDFKFSTEYFHILELINQKITIKEVSNFVVDYIYRIIKFNIRKINNGVYNKELLIERQIKTILNKSNINNDNYTLFQENYLKIINIKKGLVEKTKIIQMYNNIILPPCKQKKYFRLCVLSGSKKISKKDIGVYNLILKKSPKTVLYILETVCFENRDMILKYFDIELQRRVYFIPFIDSQLNIYRIMYFDCVLDTMNFNLKNTLYDLFKCNIPILTLEGTTLYSTITSSILRTNNINELVCITVNEFIEKAIKISSDMDYYKTIRHKFHNNTVSKYYKKNYIEKIVKAIISQ